MDEETLRGSTSGHWKHQRFSASSIDRTPSVVTVYGYHGTSRTAAESIVADKHFFFSEKGVDWLGLGAYFWQDAPLRAWEWARTNFSSDPAVVGAQIRLEACIDLFDIRWEEPLREAYTLLKSLGVPPSQSGASKAHRLDYAVMNLLVNQWARRRNEVILTVRSPFQEDAPLYDGSAFSERGHVQFAVRAEAQAQRLIVEDLWILEEDRYSTE